MSLQFVQAMLTTPSLSLPAWEKLLSLQNVNWSTVWTDLVNLAVKYGGPLVVAELEKLLLSSTIAPEWQAVLDALILALAKTAGVPGIQPTA